MEKDGLNVKAGLSLLVNLSKTRSKEKACTCGIKVMPTMVIGSRTRSTGRVPSPGRMGASTSGPMLMIRRKATVNFPGQMAGAIKVSGSAESKKVPGATSMLRVKRNQDTGKAVNY